MIQLRLSRSRRGLVVVGFGLPGLLVLLAFLVAPYVLSDALRPEAAAARVRRHVQAEVARRYLGRPPGGGAALPTAESAERLAAQFRRVAALRFEVLGVKRPIPDLLHPDRPNFVVRVRVAAPDRPDEVRYFWLGWDGFDREVSRIAWLLAI